MSTSSSSEPTPAGGPDAASSRILARDESCNDDPAACDVHNHSEDSHKWFAWNKRQPAAPAATEASEASARTLARFRFAPPEPHWWDAVIGVGILYVVLIGGPAAAGAWALWKILHGGY